MRVGKSAPPSWDNTHTSIKKFLLVFTGSPTLKSSPKNAVFPAERSRCFEDNKRGPNASSGHLQTTGPSLHTTKCRIGALHARIVISRTGAKASKSQHETHTRAHLRIYSLLAAHIVLVLSFAKQQQYRGNISHNDVSPLSIRGQVFLVGWNR